jgi:hypothetical protein
MKKILILLSAVLIGSAAFAQDTTPPCAIMSFSAAINVASIEFANCTAAAPKPTLKSEAIVTIGETKIPSEVIDVASTVFGPVTSTIITVRPTIAAGTRNYQPADGPEYSGDAASVTFGTTRIPLILANPVSHAEQTAHVGQATGEAEDGTTPSTPADPTAFGFQYVGAYVVFPLRGDVKKRWIDRGLQQEYKLSIDTTNRTGSTFTDDNEASAAVYLPRFNAGKLLNRARFGSEISYNRTLHGTNRNLDGKLMFEGWLPFFQAQTLFSKNRFAAPPLSFSLGWGYRDSDVSDVHANGSVFDGTVAYHLYLLDQYRVDFEHRTVVNQLSDRAETIPKTQHTWKASVLMSPKPGSAFSAVVSFENGHSGPVFTKLRQYFIGIGLEHLFDRKAATTP